MTDALVVGGGPAGSLSARRLSKFCDVTVVEEHETIGLPMGCSGLISQETINSLGIKPVVLNKYTGMNLIFPNGKEIKYCCNGVKAILVDRSEMDCSLAEAAMDAGVEYKFNEKIVNISNNKIQTSSGWTTSPSLIIGADGQNSCVRKVINNSEPTRFVRGLQYDISYKSNDLDAVTVILGNNIAPGFFAWIIPYDDVVRIGLCASMESSPPAVLMKRILQLFEINNQKIITKFAGKIPLGLCKKSYADGIMLIGDSASQVKPMSGGGLYPIVKAVPHLESVARKCFEINDFSSSALSEYDRLWKKDLSKEIKTGMVARKLYGKLNDDDINKAYNIASTPKALKAVSEGTIDQPSIVVKKLMRDPMCILKSMPLAFKGLIR